MLFPEIETLGIIIGFIDCCIPADKAGLPVTHDKLEVSITLTKSLLFNEPVEKVGVLAPFTGLPFTVH